MKRNKYGNKKTTLDGIKFDSVAEARFYGLLKSLKLAKKIDGFELQKKYELQEGFRHNGKAVRSIDYYADFVVARGDKIDIIDVKGHETEVFKLKRKMFIKKYEKDILVIKDINEYLIYLKGNDGQKKD